MTVAFESLPESPYQERLGEALQRLDEIAGDLELVPGAWHGDWTPWNMARRRGLLQLWDWERFELGVPEGLDRCHYGVNAVCRRDGVTPGSVLAGLRLAGVDPHASAPEGRPLAAAYLAAVTCRYLVGAELEPGGAGRNRGLTMLAALSGLLGIA
jgi:hypothetical protein